MLCASVGGDAGMSYKQTSTSCVVRLTSLRGLSPAIRAQCQALRQEAGRLWTNLVALNVQAPAKGPRRLCTIWGARHVQAPAQGQGLRASDPEPATSSQRPKAGSTPSLARA